MSTARTLGPRFKVLRVQLPYLSGTHLMRQTRQGVALSVLWLGCGADTQPLPESPARRVSDGSVSSSPPPQLDAARPQKELGIGVVQYAAMPRYEAEDVIHTGPSFRSDTLAVLNRDSLCFTGDGCVPSYGRMIEFDYEVPGWAILALTGDSAWAQVTLAPADPNGPKGWVSLRGDGVVAVLWSRILFEKDLFFLNPSDIAFHPNPVSTARVQPILVRDPHSGRPDYSMRPIEARGAWFRVELLTPGPLCKEPVPQISPDTVWIQHLTAAGRPRVFYHTRGC